MAGSWTNTAIRSLTVPTDAGDGARITINVNNDGAILLYDSNGTLIGSWSPTSGTAADGTTYQAGFELQTDPAGGSVYMGFNPGQGISTVIELAAVPPDLLSQAATIQASTGRTEINESLQLIGPAVVADAKDSSCQLFLNSGDNMGDTATALLTYLDNTGFSPNINLASSGVNVQSIFGGGIYQGRIVQTDQHASAGGAGLLHFGQASVNVSGASGAATFNHGASFTPTNGLFTPLTGFWQWSTNSPFGTEGFTSTQGQIICRTQTGALVASGTGVVFSYLVWM